MLDAGALGQMGQRIAHAQNDFGWFRDMLPELEDVTGDGTDRHACGSLLQLIQQGLAAINGYNGISAPGEGQGVKAKASPQVNGGTAGLPGESEGIELGDGPCRGGFQVADHPRVNGAQVMGVMFACSAHDSQRTET